MEVKRDGARKKSPDAAAAGAVGTAENSVEISQESGAVSCTKYFDALWYGLCAHARTNFAGSLPTLTRLHACFVFRFCYSPVHQLKRYYVHGDVDDCVAHWGTLMACLKQKTRFRLSDEEDAIPAQPCMWAVRSPAEAEAFWSREFPGGNGSDTAEGATERTSEGRTPMA